jgi:hypothetical protein
MKLRVGRGLFRLWAVISVFWIAGVAIETWRSYPADERGVLKPVTDPALLALLNAPDAGSVRAVDEKPAFDQSKPYMVVRDSERRDALQSGVLLALGLPALVFLIGLSLSWALRGFSTVV